MIRQGRAGYPVREIVVHCAATRPSWMHNRPLADKVAEIRRWHVEDRGWRDIGYHWVIDRDGAVAPGRAETEIGAHVAGHNAGTIAISLIGGHGASADDRFADHFTPAQDAALRRLIAEIEGRAGGALQISGHNEYAPKACPGFHVARWYRQGGA